jgi:hypothetical protein
MEGKLRNKDDTFNIPQAEHCLEIVAGYIHQVASAQFKHGLPGHTTDVAQLKGLWLQWWVGKVQGVNMNPLPSDAYKPTYLQRLTGEHSTVDWDSGHRIMEFMKRARIGVTPLKDNRWEASSALDDGCCWPFTGDTLEEAVLRAIVGKGVGGVLPENPADFTGPFYELPPAEDEEF